MLSRARTVPNTTPRRHNISIQYLSDIRLHENEEPVVKKCGEYLALCGNIGNPFDKDYERFLRKVSGIYKDVFLVPGNIEYHFAGMSATNLRLSMHAAEIENLHVLNNGHYDISETLRVVGTPLWSNVNDMTAMGLEDFTRIRVTLDTFMTPRYHRKLHQTALDFVKGQKIQCGTGRDLVVLSNYAPVKNMVSPRDHAYANDLDMLLDTPVIAWICGHSHEDSFISL